MRTISSKLIFLLILISVLLIPLQCDTRHSAHSAGEITRIADSDFFIDGNKSYAVIIRTPSFPQGYKHGYCMAGQEDRIAIQIESTPPKLIVGPLIQSCLNSISLYSENGEEIENTVKSSSFPIIATFSSVSQNGIDNLEAVFENGEIIIRKTSH